MPRRFALDQNFPEPIVDGLTDWLATDAELVPIRRIDHRMATLEDWQVLVALHADEDPVPDRKRVNELDRRARGSGG